MTTSIVETINDEREKIPSFVSPLIYVVPLLWRRREELPLFYSQVRDLAEHPDELVRNVAHVLGDSAQKTEMLCPFCSCLKEFRYIDAWSSGPPLPIQGYPDELGQPCDYYMCETCSGVVHTTLVSGNYLSYHDSQRQALERIQSILDEADLPDPVPAYIQNIRESLLVLRYSKDVEQARRDHIRALHAAEERRRQREWVEHRLALSVRTQNILESEWIVTVDQLCGLSADELLQLRHMKEAQLEEIRTQLDKVGRCLRGERTSFDEDFERFMRLGKPKSVCEVFGFCREYVRGHPETRAEVLARMANSDNSRLVLNALPPLERWLRLQDESRAENDRKQKRHQLLQEAPESIRSALWRFDSYDSGCLSQEAFRWEIFHHIRPDNISLLEEYLGRLFGEPADDMSPIKHWLQDLLNDDDWDQPHWAIIGEEQEIAAAWESHRAGIATVKDYLESNSPD